MRRVTRKAHGWRVISCVFQCLHSVFVNQLGARACLLNMPRLNHGTLFVG